MSYIGDFRLGDTFDTKFTTRQISGAPATLASSPVISAYVGNSTTEITAGITLSVDFDSRTGLNNVRVVATSGNGYATASNYQLVITTGTVNSVSVVGEVIAEFSIEARSAVMPTTAARTLDVSATGEAGVDWANVGSPTTTLNLSGTSTKAVEPTVAGRTLDVSAGGEAGVDWANVGTPGSTVNLSATTINLANTTTTVTNQLTAAAIATGVWTDTTAGDFTVALSVGKSVMNGVSLGTGLTIASVSGAVGSVTGAVGSVTGAVGSVTAAVTLTAAYDAAKTASQAGDAMALTGGERTTLAGVINTTAIVESYRANGAAPTHAQFMSEVLAHLGESSISGTTKTTKKLDHSTTAQTFTLDSAVTPASITRAT